MNNQCFFDKNSTRYQLVKSIPGNSNYNWLFLPGGPGIDSNYLLDLISRLNFEGNYYLVDFVLNGTNQGNGKIANEAFAQWGEYLISAVKRFENPILVGHSFGGYFPLFFPELENLLRGFIIVSSTPSFDSPEFEKCVKKNKLPSRVVEQTEFLQNPTVDTAKQLYLSGIPYCFSKEYAEVATKLIESLSINAEAGYWWYTEGKDLYTDIQWIPASVPVLILGGDIDSLTPINVFKHDARFQRNNIEIVSILDAGHFPWIERPMEIVCEIDSFLSKF